MKTLITGFGPFDVYSFNPSEKIAERLAEEDPDVSMVILPVEYYRARDELLKILRETHPDLLISFGLDWSIGHVGVEEIAVNIRSSEKSDESGRTITDQRITEEGPLAYRTLLPARDIMVELRESGIPAKISYSAGVYLCNEVFYTGLEWAQENDRHAGFVHVPMATEMIAEDPSKYNMPNLSMDMLHQAGKCVLDVSRNRIR